MLSRIQKGNAQADGQEFYQWFVGDFGSWTAENQAAFDPAQAGLRDTRKLEIKWGVHPRGEQRPGGWADTTEKISLSLLVRGILLLKFRDPQVPDLEVEHRLWREGDYVIWREDVEHTWEAWEDSLVLTVRWIE